MKPFIFGSRSGIYIIDLVKTERQLEVTRAFLAQVARQGEQVLFIGAKKQARPIVKQAAIRCGMPYVVNRWLGGTLTNFQTIKRNIERMLTLRQQKATGYFERLSKKDAKRHERQLAKLEEHFEGLAAVERPPACLYVVDPKREQNAVYEANRLGIPIVAICDTNADPDLIAYPIPGNDDAIRAIQLITTLVTETILEARKLAGLPTPRTESAAAGTDGADGLSGASPRPEDESADHAQAFPQEAESPPEANEQAEGSA